MLELALLSDENSGSVHKHVYTFIWEDFEVEVTTESEVTHNSPQTHCEPADYGCADYGQITDIELKPYDDCSVWNLLSCRHERLLIQLFEDLFPNYDLLDGLEPRIMDDEKSALQFKLNNLQLDFNRLQRDYNALKEAAE